MTAILHSNLETDLRLAAIIESELRMLLADNASIRNTGALVFAGDVAGTGSDTKRLRYAGLDGTDEMVVTAAEDTDITTTALTDASADIAVVRYGLRRDISDLANLTGFAGSDVDPFALAKSMVPSFEAAFMQLVADLVDDFATDVGTTTVNMSVDDAYDAVFTLEIADVTGPYFSLIHARQLADLQESLRAEGGAAQFVAATADMLSIKGQGFAGEFLGVGWHRSSKVNSAGGNRHGAMWGTGALAYAVGTQKPIVGAGGEVRPSGTPVVVEFQRDASAANTETVAHAYMGGVIAEDARGVGIVTDA